MGTLMSCGTIVSAIAAAIMLGLIKDEFSAWIPKLSSAIIRYSAKRLNTEDLRVRYLEEWLAHSADCPGKLSQLAQSFLFLRASIGITPLKRRYKYIIIAGLVGHSSAAMAAPSVIDYFKPSCGCASSPNIYLITLSLVIPYTIFNLGFELFLERKGWLHHRRRKSS